MTNAELLQYLTDYLHTNDTKTLANMQNFIALAAARVKTQVTGGMVEVYAPFTPLASQQLPTGFISFRSMSVNGVPLSWLSPDDFDSIVLLLAADTSAETNSRWYTIRGTTLDIIPAPAIGITGMQTYYMLDASAPTAISAAIPSLLIRGAAYEAYLYEGDMESAQAELQGFSADMQFSMDSRFNMNGSIAMGGV